MRRDARVVAFQIIFSKMFASDQIEEPFFDSLKKENDISFAKSVVENFLEHKQDLDEQIKGGLVGYQIDRVYKVDLALLYLVLTEVEFLDTPKQVAINEALEIAKKYSTDKSPKFLNGVLSSVLRGKDK